LCGRRRTYQHGFVGHLDVKRATIGFRIDRDRLDPQPARGLDDAASDLAAICNENTLEHRPARPGLVRNPLCGPPGEMSTRRHKGGLCLQSAAGRV
jgi:hypothetical protein